MKFISIGEYGEIKGLTETEWTLIVCLDASPDRTAIINELKQSVNIDRVIELLKYYYRRLPVQVDQLRAAQRITLTLEETISALDDGSLAWRLKSTHPTQYYFLTTDYRSQIDSILKLLAKSGSSISVQLRPIDEAAILHYKRQAGLINQPSAKELKKANSFKLYEHFQSFTRLKRKPPKKVIEKILPHLKVFPEAHKLALAELEN